MPPVLTFPLFVLFRRIIGRRRFRRQARTPPASAFHIWCGGILDVSSEDVVGKHLAERVGFHRGGWDPGSWRPSGTNPPLRQARAAHAGAFVAGTTGLGL